VYSDVVDLLAADVMSNNVNVEDLHKIVRKGWAKT